MISGINMYKLLITIVLLYSFVGCSKNNNNANKPSGNQESTVMSGDKNKAPEFTLASTEGKDVKLSDYKGKVVIVDFWATWCGPCRRGIPDLIDIQKQYGNDVVVIGISLDQNKGDVLPFAQKIGINYPIVYGTLEVTQQYGGVEGIPTSFIINKNGDIVDKHVGLVDKSEYTDLINKLLKES
jgi:thiol-disulfide isomerase/thioredoxin